ncbi:MAG: DUF3108 domain-containing protein [Candidatus Gygaella obscura]|nr:DUF3108 domain-containing protein [Candidatus Gygaella obscura]
MIKLILKKFILLIIIISLVSFAIELILSSPSLIVKNVLSDKNIQSGQLFQKGRKFSFKFSYSYFLPIGVSDFQVESLEKSEGGDIYKLFATAKTNKVLTSIYEAKAKLISFLDKNKMHSLHYEEIITTKEEIKSKRIDFDQFKHVASREDKQYKILPDTQDPVSMIFVLLSRKLKIGDEYSDNIFTKECNYEFKSKVVDKKDNIFHLKIKVGRQDKSSSHGGDFDLYVFDKGYNIPLSIRGWTQAGMITLRLIDIN